MMARKVKAAVVGTTAAVVAAVEAEFEPDEKPPTTVLG